MVELGEMTANPADLLPAPSSRDCRDAQADEWRRCCNRIPATTPLELRDRAMFELAYACGLRAEELVNLDLESIDFDAEQVRVEGRGKTRCRAGRRAGAALRRALPRARPAGPGRGRRRCSALLLSKSGRRLSTSDVRRRLRVWARLPTAAPVSGRSGSCSAASVSTTPDYTRIESARLRAAYARSHPRA